MTHRFLTGAAPHVASGSGNRRDSELTPGRVHVLPLLLQRDPVRSLGWFQPESIAAGANEDTRGHDDDNVEENQQEARLYDANGSR